MRISLALPWSSLEFKIIRRILRDDGEIRASKPPIKDRIDSYAAYVWRMVGFICSCDPKMHHLPVMCYYDLIVASEEERAMVVAELGKLVDKITSLIPPEEWYGARRWVGLL